MRRVDEVARECAGGAAGAIMDALGGVACTVAGGNGVGVFVGAGVGVADGGGCGGGFQAIAGAEGGFVRRSREVVR